MQTRFLFLFLLNTYLLFDVQAQELPASVKEIVAAENRFAAMSKERNTRDAFVEHLADSAIVFERTVPVLGKQVWGKRNADESLLFWWPVFSDVAASGDFGYNTGPFEWSKEKTDAKPSAFGYFSSVWKKDKDGVWKVAIDIGMGMPTADDKVPALSTSKNVLRKTKKKFNIANEKQRLLQLDSEYIEQLNKQAVSFLDSYFSEEARLHRIGHMPLLTAQGRREFVDNREAYSFEQQGGDMASSADMAYTYGKVNAIDRVSKKPLIFNYLHIWKKENGKDWKIVLDVIGG